jgi:hypothetical protein
MHTLGFSEVILLALVALGAVSVIWPAARICRRAGFPAWFGVGIIFPIVNLALLWFVAYARWPARDSAPGAS